VTLLPRHALLLRRGQEVSPMCPEYSVTYLAGRTLSLTQRISATGVVLVSLQHAGVGRAVCCRFTVERPAQPGECAARFRRQLAAVRGRPWETPSLVARSGGCTDTGESTGPLGWEVMPHEWLPTLFRRVSVGRAPRYKFSLLGSYRQRTGH